MNKIVREFAFTSALLLMTSAVSITGVYAQTPLEPPTLHAEAVTDTSIRIRWDASPSATQYTVSVNGSPLAITGSLTFIHTRLTPDTAYTFTITATDGSTTSAPSAPLTVTESVTPTVTDLSFRYATDGRTNVSFTTSLAGTYRITYTLANDETFVAIKRVIVSAEQVGSPVTALLFTRPGYVGTVGITFNDITYASSTIATPPSPPTLVAGEITDTSIAFSWTAQRSATEYLIYRDATFLTTTSDLSYIHTGLTPDTEYTYSAESRYGTTTSPPSFPLTVSTTVLIYIANLDGESGVSIKDAKFLYYAYTFEPELNDSNVRIEVLGPLTSAGNNELGDLLTTAKGLSVDLNLDGTTNAEDAAVLYYSFALEGSLGDGTPGSGIREIKEAILGPLAGTNNDMAAIDAMLQRAYGVREP